MPSFMEVLYNLPTERLRKLVQNRHLETNKKLALIPNKKQLVQFLESELVKPASIAEAITFCNGRELRMLQLLMGAESEQLMSWANLLEAAGGDANLSDALEAVLIRLEELGLAFGVQGPVRNEVKEVKQDNKENRKKEDRKETKRPVLDVFMPGAVRPFVPASLSDRYTLERCLEQYDANSIKRICDRLGLPQDTKIVNIQAIKQHLMLHGAGLQLKHPLTAEEVDVLEYVVQAGGAATAFEVATAVLSDQSEDFFRYEWQNRWKQGKERNAVDTLLARGLLYVVAYVHGYNLFLIIPGDLLRTLTGNGDMAFWTSPPLVPTRMADAPPRTMRHVGLLRDVVALLGFVSTQDAARTNTGHIHKTSLKNLMRGLSLPEERYASFLYAVCREAGLITTQGDRQVYKITPTGHTWLYRDSVAQIHMLVEAWRRGALWGEMYNDPLHKVNDYRSTEGIVRMREAALSIIKETSNRATADTEAKSLETKNSEANVSEKPGSDPAFYDLSSVTDTLAFRYPLLLVNSAKMGPDLVASPANFIRLLVGECLFWLGVVELAMPAPAPGAVNSLVPVEAGAKASGNRADYASARGAASAKSAVPDTIGFRLAPEGAYLLEIEGVSAPVPDPREDQFIVQANGEIFLSPYLEPATLYHLLAITETPAKGATGNTVMLTRDSIRRCLDQGERPRDVLAFLQKHSRTGIPQNVEYLINDVGGKHGHIHLGKAQMYLQVDTPLLLKELTARRELKPFFVRNLSDTVAVLNTDDLDKLLRELRKAGYLPVSDEATPQSTLRLSSPPPSVPALTLPSKQAEAKKQAERSATIDWDRIAQEDKQQDKQENEQQDKQENEQSVYQQGKEADRDKAAAPTGTVSNAVRNPALIKTLLQQACKTHTVVELQYAGAGQTQAMKREVEPERLVGNYLNAFDRLTDATTSFVVARIQWARLTGEIFPT